MLQAHPSELFKLNVKCELRTNKYPKGRLERNPFVGDTVSQITHSTHSQSVSSASLRQSLRHFPQGPPSALPWCVHMQSNAAPPRRTAPSIARLNQASVEFWKAENQKLRDRNASLHRRLHKYKKYISLHPLNRQLILCSFVCTLQEDARKFTFIHKGHRYEFPRLLILARSHVYPSPRPFLVFFVS